MKSVELNWLIRFKEDDVMNITQEQIQKLLSAYESNEKTLKDVEAMYNDYGHVGNDNTPEETHEQGYNDALEFVFKILGIEY